MPKFFSILEIGFSLAQTRFKLRYEGSYLGVFWYLLDPLAKFGILLLVGSALNQNAIPHYPVYLFLGIMIFDFFAASTGTSIHLMPMNASFINSMCIDKEPFVISNLLECIFSHCFSVLILIFLMLTSGLSLTGLVFYFLIFTCFCFFILGVGFLLSAVGVYVTDLSNVWGIFVNLLWIATPVFYTLKGKSLLSDLNQLNPLYYFISASRAAVIESRMPDFHTFLFTLMISLVTFLSGLLIFQKIKHGFAERL